MNSRQPPPVAPSCHDRGPFVEPPPRAVHPAPTASAELDAAPTFNLSVQPSASANLARRRPSAPSSPASRSSAAPPQPTFAAAHSAADGDRLLRSAPPWLVSTLLHMTLLLVLGLCFFPQVAPHQLRLALSFSEQMGDQLKHDPIRVTLDSQTLEAPVLTPANLQPVDDPLLAPPPAAVAEVGALASTELLTPDIGLALTGRTRGMKQILLTAYGGNATTEAAVAAGLKWLAAQQMRDGTWSLAGPYSDGAYNDNPTSATAMALLAFLGAGHTHQAGPYRRTVGRGAQALLRMQARNGDFWKGTVPNHRLYSQAQAMIAVCELYGMTEDSQYRLAAQKSVDYAAKTQDQLGGWRYRPGYNSDTSVTGWFVMGLQSARMAGIEVPRETLEQVSLYLDRASSRDLSRYGYQPGSQPSVAMTAEALLCRQYLGWPRENPALQAGVAYLVEEPMDWSQRNVYQWYYVTQVLHHVGGDTWEQWNQTMREMLPAQQTKEGPETGSWSPLGDRWGAQGGRLYVTCLSLYMLEVYYRHLPLYGSVGP